MIENLVEVGGTRGIWIALILGVAVIVGALFVGGRPTDIGKPKWQVWAISGVVLLGVLLLVSHSISQLTYQSCSGSSYVAC